MPLDQRETQAPELDKKRESCLQVDDPRESMIKVTQVVREFRKVAASKMTDNSNKNTCPK